MHLRSRLVRRKSVPIPLRHASTYRTREQSSISEPLLNLAVIGGLDQLLVALRVQRTA